jgi:hypothetical protein
MRSMATRPVTMAEPSGVTPSWAPGRTSGNSRHNAASATRATTATSLLPAEVIDSACLPRWRLMMASINRASIVAGRPPADRRRLGRSAWAMPESLAGKPPRNPASLAAKPATAPAAGAGKPIAAIPSAGSDTPGSPVAALAAAASPAASTPGAPTHRPPLLICTLARSSGGWSLGALSVLVRNVSTTERLKPSRTTRASFPRGNLSANDAAGARAASSGPPLKEALAFLATGLAGAARLAALGFGAAGFFAALRTALPERAFCLVAIWPSSYPLLRCGVSVRRKERVEPSDAVVCLRLTLLASLRILRSDDAPHSVVSRYE